MKIGGQLTILLPSSSAAILATHPRRQQRRADSVMCDSACGEAAEDGDNVVDVWK
jgi:hypothetical protein